MFFKSVPLYTFHFISRSSKVGVSRGRGLWPRRFSRAPRRGLWVCFRLRGMEGLQRMPLNSDLCAPLTGEGGALEPEGVCVRAVSVPRARCSERGVPSGVRSLAGPLLRCVFLFTGLPAVRPLRSLVAVSAALTAPPSATCRGPACAASGQPAPRPPSRSLAVRVQPCSWLSHA